MKKYRKFIIPLVLIILIISMALPSSAAGEFMSLHDLLGEATLIGWREYLNDSGGTVRVSAPATWSDSTPGAINVGSNSSGFAHTAVGFGTDTLLGDGRFSVSKNDILIFNCNSLSMFQITNPSGSTSSLNLTVTIEFVDSGDYNHTVVVFDGAPYSANDHAAYFRWDFQYQIPSTYVAITAINFDFEIPSSTFWDFAFYSNYIQFFVGSEQNAPIYDSPDTSYLDDLKAQEDQLRGQTSSGLAQTNTIFSTLDGLLGLGSFTGEGLIACSALISPVWDIFTELLVISLGVGLIMFVIGTISTITASAVSARSRSEAAEFRATKGEYYRERINYYRNRR